MTYMSPHTLHIISAAYTRNPVLATTEETTQETESHVLREYQHTGDTMVVVVIDASVHEKRTECC